MNITWNENEEAGRPLQTLLPDLKLSHFPKWSSVIWRRISQLPGVSTSTRTSFQSGIGRSVRNLLRFPVTILDAKSMEGSNVTVLSFTGMALLFRLIGNRSGNWNTRRWRRGSYVVFMPAVTHVIAWRRLRLNRIWGCMIWSMDGGWSLHFNCSWIENLLTVPLKCTAFGTLQRSAFPWLVHVNTHWPHPPSIRLFLAEEKTHVSLVFKCWTKLSDRLTTLIRQKARNRPACTKSAPWSCHSVG